MDARDITIATLQRRIEHLEVRLEQLGVRVDGVQAQVPGLEHHVDHSQDWRKLWHLLSFQYQWIGGNVVRINDGSLRLHGAADPVTIAGEDITLEGETCWLYIEFPKNDPSSAVFQTSANEPKTEASTWRHPLYQFAAYAEDEYRMVRDCRFDVNYGAPLTT